MRICIVTSGPFPLSIRLEKQIRTFRELGYEIHVVCLTAVGQSTDDVVSGVSVHRITEHKGLGGRLARLVFKTLFIDVQFLQRLWSTVKRYQIEILFVRDLPCVLTACLVGRLARRKVIYDVNDRYPVAMNSWGLKRSWNERILMSTRRMARLERRCVKAVDHIVVPTSPYVDFFAGMGIPRRKITLLPNYVDLAHVDGLASSAGVGRVSRWFTIFYAGSFGRHRGLDVAIRALPFLVGRIRNVRLVLVGPLAAGDEVFRRELEQLAQHLGVAGYVVFTGFLEFEKVVGLMESSDVCLLPFNRTDHTNTGLAHKLFEYMSQAKPVVTTDVGLYASLIERERCGLVVPAGEASRLAEMIVTLYENPDLARELGQRGRQAVETKYNWTSGAREFVELCRRLDRVAPSDVRQ